MHHWDDRSHWLSRYPPISIMPLLAGVSYADTGSPLVHAIGRVQHRCPCRNPLLVVAVCAPRPRRSSILAALLTSSRLAIEPCPRPPTPSPSCSTTSRSTTTVSPSPR